MDSYRSTNGRIKLPRSPNHGARTNEGALDFLSPQYAPSAKHIDSRPREIDSNGSISYRRDLSESKGRSQQSDRDGLSLRVPLTERRRMRKSMEKRNLRLLIDTNDPHFPGLKRLKFRGKELNSLPNDVFQLKELELLDLSPEREACLYYKLPGIPSSIGKLVNLKVLIVDTNELVEVAPEIGLLPQLEHLTLSNNWLTGLPDEIKMLRNLTSLHLANNKFEVFPIQVCELESLTFLDLSDNKIDKIPRDIEKMKQLETLLLYANELTELPDELCDLQELRMLWIGENLIRILPRHFGKLKFLDWDWHYTSTTLDGNPLEHPPIDVCRKGPASIEKYFQDHWPKIQKGMPVYTPDPIYIREKAGVELKRQRDEEKRNQDRRRSDEEKRYQDRRRSDEEKRCQDMDRDDEKRYQERRRDQDKRYSQHLDVDDRMMRDVRRGSSPIPTPVPDGLAALDNGRR